jgi:carbamoyl-phosphate synthase large subunit
VLLTAAGGLGMPSIIDCLKNNYEKRKIKIICTDIIEKPIMHYKADEFYLLPTGSSKNYMSSLIRICKKNKVDVVIPNSASEILTISHNLSLLHSNNISATVSVEDSVKKIMTKNETYKILEENKIPVPEFYLVNDKNEFHHALKMLGYDKNPVCFKPSDYGSSGGGRGFKILRKGNSIDDIILKNKPDSAEIDYETALRLFNKHKKLNLLVMEYLPGDEYSVYILANKGNMIFCVPQLRERLEQSYSFEASVKKNKKIIRICKKIAKVMNLDYNSNIQIKLSKNNQPKVVEINPRMGGSIALSAAAGVNLPYLSIKLALGEKLPKHDLIYNTKMIRYWKELFVIEKTSKIIEY